MPFIEHNDTGQALMRSNCSTPLKDFLFRSSHNVQRRHGGVALIFPLLSHKRTIPTRKITS